MKRTLVVALLTCLAATAHVQAQSQPPAQPPAAAGRGAPPPLPEGATNNPFPQPIAREEGAIAVPLREFASLPDIDGVAARMMTLVEEPSTGRLFVSDMRGQLYTVSADGKAVTAYLNINDPKWAIRSIRKAASAGCRASCCIHNSRRPAHRGSASSTPTSIRPT